MNRNFILIVAGIMSAALISGCARMPKQVRAQGETIAFREAFEREGAVNVNGLLVKAQIPGRKEQKRLFAFNLNRKELTPVLITVTNKSRRSVMVETSSTRFGVKKPLSIDHVWKNLYKGVWGRILAANVFSFGLMNLSGGNKVILNKKQMKNEAIRIALYEKSFHQSIVAPGSTVMGYLFFEGKKAEQAGTIELKAQNLDQVSYFKIQVKVIAQ